MATDCGRGSNECGDRGLPGVDPHARASDRRRGNGNRGETHVERERGMPLEYGVYAGRKPIFRASHTSTDGVRQVEASVGLKLWRVSASDESTLNPIAIAVSEPKSRFH